MVTQVKINTKAQEISIDSLLSNNQVINSNSRLENIEGFKSVMLIYPPSKLYQRGEDRSQGNIEDSTATTIRAANDLGYAASMLKKSNYLVFLRKSGDPPKIPTKSNKHWRTPIFPKLFIILYARHPDKTVVGIVCGAIMKSHALII